MQAAPEICKIGRIDACSLLNLVLECILTYVYSSTHTIEHAIEVLDYCGSSSTHGSIEVLLNLVVMLTGNMRIKAHYELFQNRRRYFRNRGDLAISVQCVKKIIIPALTVF